MALSAATSLALVAGMQRGEQEGTVSECGHDGDAEDKEVMVMKVVVDEVRAMLMMEQGW